MATVTDLICTDNLRTANRLAHRLELHNGVQNKVFNLMYHFITWVTEETAELLKMAKGDEFETWRKVMKIIKSVSSMKNAAISGKPPTEGNAETSLAPEESDSRGKVETAA